MSTEIRNISDDVQIVFYGILPPGSQKRVAPDGVITVTDEAAPAYAVRAAVWQLLGEARPVQLQLPVVPVENADEGEE